MANRLGHAEMSDSALTAIPSALPLDAAVPTPSSIHRHHSRLPSSPISLASDTSTELDGIPSPPSFSPDTPAPQTLTTVSHHDVPTHVQPDLPLDPSSTLDRHGTNTSLPTPNVSMGSPVTSASLVPLISSAPGPPILREATLSSAEPPVIAARTYATPSPIVQPRDPSNIRSTPSISTANLLSSGLHTHQTAVAKSSISSSTDIDTLPPSNDIFNASDGFHTTPSFRPIESSSRRNSRASVASSRTGSIASLMSKIPWGNTSAHAYSSQVHATNPSSLSGGLIHSVPPIAHVSQPGSLVPVPESNHVHHTTSIVGGVSQDPSNTPVVLEKEVGRPDPGTDDNVDWEFWGKVVQDYDKVAREHPEFLRGSVLGGIPSKIRGTVWILMSGGRDLNLDHEFHRLLPLPTPYEKLIQRDLPRTFPNNSFFQESDGQDALYNVVKAYSLYDTEVGYCQGIAFLAAPLLLNMPDNEAFCVLVRLLNLHKLREHYTPQMHGLRLRLFQFDRLLENMMPDVFAHLTNEGVNSSMYATQWFLTLFAYRFPLELVIRVFDMIFAEGSNVLFRISLAIIKRHEETLTTLKFEHLLDYLKMGLFDYYNMDNEHVFVQDALDIKLDDFLLRKWTTQYTLEHGEDGVPVIDQAQATIETLNSANKQLEVRIRNLETNLTLINQEHVELANKLLQVQIESIQLQSNNEQLTQEVAKLRNLFNDEQQRIMEGHRRALHARDLDYAALKEQNEMLAMELIDVKVRFAESESQNINPALPI